MNLNELGKWALKVSKNDSISLMALGAKEGRLTKVKAMSKAIFDRCQIIIQNTEKNEKHLGEIEEYLKLLASYGLAVPEEKEENAKVESPVVETAPQAKEPLTVPNGQDS